MSSAEVASSRIRIGRVLQQRARDRQPLPLAARQLLAALADSRPISLGQRRDEVVRVGRPGRPLRSRLRVARSGPVRDVVGDRVVEQHGFLRHDADLRAQRFQRHLADVASVDQNGAAA